MLDEIVAGVVKEKEDLARQFGAAGSITTYFNVFQEVVPVKENYTIISTKELGSPFILADATWGKLGTQSPQPILGSGIAYGSYTVVRVFSPDNIFIESFLGSRFKDINNTTANWAQTGSCTL